MSPPVTGAPIGALVTADTPNVWTTQWSADGKTLFVPDMTTGLYSLEPQWDFEATAQGGDDQDAPADTSGRAHRAADG